MPVCEVTQLRNAGLYLTHARELYGDEFAGIRSHVIEWLESDTVQAECRKFAEGTRVADIKPFTIKYREHRLRVYEHDDPLLLLDNAAVRSIVEEAIGTPKCICIDLWHNPPGCNQHAPLWSQSWHRDPEDSSPIKVFIYFAKVDEESGPFEYVLGSPWMFYDVCPPCSYPAKPIDTGAIPERMFVKVTGGPGTVAFANTSGIHRGGHGAKPRTMAVLTYVPEQSPATILYRVNR